MERIFDGIEETEIARVSFDEKMKIIRIFYLSFHELRGKV